MSVLGVAARPPRATGLAALATRVSVAAVLVMPAVACKRRETLAPIDMSVPETDRGIAADAKRMAWRGITSTRSEEDNGAIVVWLEEAGTGLGHVRFVLPTRAFTPLGGSTPLDAALTWVVADALEAEWRRRLLAWDVGAPPAAAGHEDRATPLRGELSVEHRPGRLELVVHVEDADVGRVLAAWGELVSSRRIESALSRAQGRLVASTAPPSADLVAIAHAVELATGEPARTQLTTRAELQRLGTPALEKAWSQILDPRHAVVIVHASSGRATLVASLATWNSQWRGRGLAPGRRDDARDALLSRVLPSLGDTAKRERLMAIPPLTVRAVDVPGPGHGASLQAVFARVVPTPTARDRALLRLGQRVLQEELDLRVVFAGAHALVLARLPLSPAAPDRALVEGAARWRAVLEGAITKQRLDTTARLWLGARWVSASLDAEDATALWSEAMELSSHDEGISRALDDETAAMLAIEVDAWTSFARRWLDPSKGEPGWVGVIAGADQAQLARLAEIIPVKR